MGFEDTGYYFGAGGGDPDCICEEMAEFRCLDRCYEHGTIPCRCKRMAKVDNDHRSELIELNRTLSACCKTSSGSRNGVALDPLECTCRELH